MSLGWTCSNLNDESRAIKLLEEAISGGDAGIFAYIQLSRTYLRIERFDRAILLLEEALSMDPENGQLHLILGEIHLGQGRFREAEVSFSKAVKMDRTPEKAAIRIARHDCDLGMRRKAIESYEHAMEQGSPGALLLNNLAWAYGEENIHLQRALELSLQAVKLEEENVVYSIPMPNCSFYRPVPAGHRHHAPGPGTETGGRRSPRVSARTIG